PQRGGGGISSTNPGAAPRLAAGEVGSEATEALFGGGQGGGLGGLFGGNGESGASDGPQFDERDRTAADDAAFFDNDGGGDFDIGGGGDD
ncbi:hypothetical protein J8J27_28300, partial [Mycobacterium tuberculosis]|nr:hypothetical protein [Mycobacterium tuberculosis]